MLQTVKFGKLRATQDPDRDEHTVGLWYGLNFYRNIPGPFKVELLAQTRMAMRAPVKR